MMLANSVAAMTSATGPAGRPERSAKNPMNIQSPTAPRLKITNASSDSHAAGACAIEAHGDYIVWLLETMRDRGTRVVDVRQEPENAYAQHCRKMDVATAPLRDCISYYNGEGDAEPGSLAYYGGNRWHKYRFEAQTTLDPYVFE